MPKTRSAAWPQLSDFQSSGPWPSAAGTGNRYASLSGVAATRSRKSAATVGGRFSIKVCVSLTDVLRTTRQGLSFRAVTQGL